MHLYHQTRSNIISIVGRSTQTNFLLTQRLIDLYIQFFIIFKNQLLNIFIISNQTKKKTKNRKSTKHKQVEKASDKKEKEKGRD